MKIRNLGIGVAMAILLMASDISRSQQQAATPIYGQQLMTVQEREQHRERIRTAATEEERNKIREEHRKQMQARAQEQKVQLPDVAAPGAGPKGGAQQVRGRELMTEEERARHREEMRNMATEEEREKARQEKHEQMKERAEKQGVTLPDKPLPRGRGMGQGGGPGGGRR
jgi:hypothetical protein